MSRPITEHEINSLHERVAKLEEINSLHERVAKLEEINRKLCWDRDDAEEEASHRRAQICQIAQALGVDHMVALPEDGSEWPLPDLCRKKARELRAGLTVAKAQAFYVQPTEEDE